MIIYLFVCLLIFVNIISQCRRLNIPEGERPSLGKAMGLMCLINIPTFLSPKMAATFLQIKKHVLGVLYHSRLSLCMT